MKDIEEVTVYADDTGLFDEESIDREGNCVAFFFPRWVVKEFYETSNDHNVFTLEHWLREVYTCDETIGLYGFSKVLGVHPLPSAAVDTPAFKRDVHERYYTYKEAKSIIGGYKACQAHA